MPSFIDQLLEVYNAPQLEQGFGVTVTLRRGSTESDPFTATWSHSSQEVLIENEGFANERERRDYWFAQTAVVIAGDVVTPRPGDRICEGDKVFQLVPLGNVPAVETGNDYRFVVHTQQIV